MMELNGITLAHGGKPILTGLSATITEGSFIGLLGANGAGKTSLLRVMSGIQQPTEGRLEWWGQKASTWRQWWRPTWGARIAFVPQIPPAVAFPIAVSDLFDSLSVAGKHGLEWLEILGLHGAGQRCFHALSGGEKRRVLIALALAQNPEVLFLDEADSFLDRKGREIAARVILDWWKAGAGARTVVSASHHPEEFPPDITHIWQLENGILTVCRKVQPC